MKTIFTLLVSFILATTSFAQYIQNFDGTITSGCTIVTNSYQTTVAGEVIAGAGSIYSNPPVTGSSTRDFSTPYLNITSTSLNVKFQYKLSDNINAANAIRTIEIGLQDASTFTSLQTITMNKDNDPVSPVSFDQTFSVTTGIRRLVLKMGGSLGDGSIRIIIDNLEASANSLYVGGCNTAPSVQDDNYTTPMVGVYNGSSVLANDNDSDGEALNTPTLVTPSPDGAVVFNADGTFTFTPNTGFAGSSTSFTYRSFDNGYDALSAIATVTINFSEFVLLPVQVLSFNGSIVNDMVQLKWFVAENETGKRFEIEKSIDGTNFKNSGIVLLTSKAGSENYSFAESIELTGTMYYRLKIINKNGSVNYSNVVVLKKEKAINVKSLLVLPNVGAELTFNYSTIKEGIYNVNVYTVNGAKILAARIVFQKGMNAASLNANGLISGGVYVLEVVNSSERTIAKFFK